MTLLTFAVEEANTHITVLLIGNLVFVMDVQNALGFQFVCLAVGKLSKIRKSKRLPT